MLLVVLLAAAMLLGGHRQACMAINVCCGDSTPEKYIQGPTIVVLSLSCCCLNCYTPVALRYDDVMMLVLLLLLLLLLMITIMTMALMNA